MNITLRAVVLSVLALPLAAGLGIAAVIRAPLADPPRHLSEGEKFTVQGGPVGSCVRYYLSVGGRQSLDDVLWHKPATDQTVTARLTSP